MGLLAEKKDLLERVLYMTAEFDFTGGEDDAERYVAFIAEREKLFEEIKRVDERLNGREAEEGQETRKLENEIKSVIDLIVGQNKKLDGKVTEVTDKLKSGLKEINDTRNINMRYNYDTITSSGMLFDEKK